MIKKIDKNSIRQKRHVRVRGKVSGTSARPRFNVTEALITSMFNLLTTLLVILW